MKVFTESNTAAKILSSIASKWQALRFADIRAWTCYLCAARNLCYTILLLCTFPAYAGDVLVPELLASKGIETYRQAAEQGDASAQNMGQTRSEWVTGSNRQHFEWQQIQLS